MAKIALREERIVILMRLIMFFLWDNTTKRIEIG